MRVRYTPEAVSDLENVLAYIAERNPTAAASVAAKIDITVASIGQLPFAGRLDQETGARERVVKGLPLLVIYTASEDLVEIIAIFHTSRDPAAKRRP